MTAAKKSSAKKAAASDDEATVRRDFDAVVNMSAAAIEQWLATKASRVVGAKAGETGTAPGGRESVGHRSGRRIVRLLGKVPADLTAGDCAHMKKVIGYVHRHRAQGPKSSDVEQSRWRYSLMNWGHDPMRG